MAFVHLSPELPRMTVRGHKREPSDPEEDILSASYPSPTGHFVDDGPGDFRRSFSGRPRTKSALPEIGPKQRKSLRGLGRSRGASIAWMSRARQAAEGGGAGSANRRASASDAEGATTEQVDSAFRRIKEQLAILSEEDQVLKERVERLNEEINILNIPIQKLKEMKASKQQLHTTSAASLLSPGSWKTPHFSMTICEGDYPSAKTSVPTVLISQVSREPGGSVHETIVEQTSEGGPEGGRGVVPSPPRRRSESQASPVTHRRLTGRRPNGGLLTSGALSSDSVINNQKFSFYTISQ